ncbi:OmpA family protein [Oceanomicrobium pacificus]|uniref:OmpA family protein n=1 Tax=Oceanomicrobium pacificus TaxID=2692916 RepID=A0A6B0TKR2_9RHOB|nr:OmpA family protein [Oceanomicrobium pacificus]MXU64446.1 OmpA family protein [Oceanomicrobium pacificus]
MNFSRKASRVALTFGVAGALLSGAGATFAGERIAPGGVSAKATAAAPDQVVDENVRAGIWVDPQGCEHWVIDRGAEGYMSPRLNRQGKPVCSSQSAARCEKIGQNALFDTNIDEVSAADVDRLRAFITAGLGGRSCALLVDGHTDNVGSASFNEDLSMRRARAVAALATALGHTATARAFGESSPMASNDNESGRAMNRRVELYCACEGSSGE